MEEQLAGVLVGPVVGDDVAFLGVFLDEGDDVFEAAVVADHFEGAVRADFGDRVDVVASEEDAEVNELVRQGFSQICLGWRALGFNYLISIHCQPSKDTIQMDFENRFFTLFAECEVAEKNRGVKAESIHVFRGCRIDLSCSRQHRALSLGLGWRDYVRYPHEP